jgi:hypothetical protein
MKESVTIVAKKDWIKPIIVTLDVSLTAYACEKAGDFADLLDQNCTAS